MCSEEYDTKFTKCRFFGSSLSHPPTVPTMLTHMHKHALLRAWTHPHPHAHAGSCTHTYARVHTCTPVHSSVHIYMCTHTKQPQEPWLLSPDVSCMASCSRDSPTWAIAIAERLPANPPLPRLPPAPPSTPGTSLIVTPA